MVWNGILPTVALYLLEAVNDIINIYDWYIGISVTNRELFVLHMSITGISLFIILYLYVKSHKKLTIEDSR